VNYNNKFKKGLVFCFIFDVVFVSRWVEENLGSRHAGVLVVVDRFAKVDGVAELLAQNGFARVTRHLEQKEARVTLRQEVIGRIILVQNL
jgi:hypothetical protein